MLLTITLRIFWNWQKQKNQAQNTPLDRFGPLCASGIFQGMRNTGDLCMAFQAPEQDFVVAFPQGRKKNQASTRFVRERPLLFAWVGEGWLRSAVNPRKTWSTFLWSAWCLYFPHPKSPSYQFCVLPRQLFLRSPTFLGQSHLLSP